MSAEDDDSEGKRLKLGQEKALNCGVKNFQRDLVAGALMGGVVHTIVAPIERAKLLLQTQESNLAIVASGRRRFKGMFDCIARTVREEGILSLWRGNGSSVIRYYPSVALNFSLKVRLPLGFHFLSFPPLVAFASFLFVSSLFEGLTHHVYSARIVSRCFFSLYYGYYDASAFVNCSFWVFAIKYHLRF